MHATSEYCRSSGILLPVPSLPGPFGIGDLGPQALRWIETLAKAKQVWWQVLPVSPTGFGDSPYQSPSTFAGNLNLISPELLKSEGLVSGIDIAECVRPPGPIDYQLVIRNKKQLLETAYKRFQSGDSPKLLLEFHKFCEIEAFW